LKQTAFFAALLSTIALFPSAAQAQSMFNQTISGTRLDLSARGEVRVVPDVALINAGVMTQASEAAAAMNQTAAKMQRVLAALKRAGIADRDIQTQSISLSPQYRYVENQPPVITGYQAANQLDIRFRDVARSGAILDILVKEGVNQINGPTLTVDKPEGATDAARVLALKILRTRADLYAKAAGMTVKRMVVISETSDEGPQPKFALRQAMASDATSPVAAGEQNIGVTLNAVFELQ
jgi:uncharacterized protein YggE